MIKYYNAQNGSGGFSAKSITEQFLPEINVYSQNVEELYNELINACRDASDKYSFCDYGETVSSDYFAISEALKQSKNDFLAQIDSANKQVTNYIDNIRSVEQKMAKSTEDTASLINTIKNRDYTKLYESKMNSSNTLEDDILDSIDFSDNTSNLSDDVNDSEPILESVDYSEFSNNDED
jgi:uncharacterized membrane-anchored protein YhcB (DUF1043 family)